MAKHKATIKSKDKPKSRPVKPIRPKGPVAIGLPESRTIESLFVQVSGILNQARAEVVRSVNNRMVLAYWQIGRVVVETLQGGDQRASYGGKVLEGLSVRLSQGFGTGFSVTNLRYFRLFYQTYSDRKPQIHHKAGDELEKIPKSRKARDSKDVVRDLSRAIESCETLEGFSPSLSWSHYRALSKVESKIERLFYEIEAERAGWSVPQLERQIHTFLFMRLLKSRDKAGLLSLSRKGQEIAAPIDVFKDPYVLDFLALPDGGKLRESDLETAIISQLQRFLLELGKGFAFVARQKRMAYEDEHFYVDLVFYHTILKCYLLIDLKVGKLSHQDIGQMDSYIRLFDDQFTSEGDNPTIGLILCAEKNEAVARYSVLNESKKIFAAKYLKHLPSEAELRKEMERERLLIETQRLKKGAI